jgi:hypothetical protein
MAAESARAISIRAFLPLSFSSHLQLGATGWGVVKQRLHLEDSCTCDGQVELVFQDFESPVLFIDERGAWSPNIGASSRAIRELERQA